MALVYVLQSLKQGWKYIGCTDNNKEVRLAYHNQGKVKSTRPYKPFKIVYTEEYPTFTEARKREYHLKHFYKARQELFDKIANMALSSNSL